ncbi:hypothetical protein O181_081831 [Austropuccinia psidii MF-1]|uniref:Uncharacterized protein n=1 Tax=Austropuccinia psidii MF-1 TaxID=1389203 RepID=A0A9Q3FKY8_9BASI|nr:hypothetical protein [Austropuccinia psidii MF-1]
MVSSLEYEEREFGDLIKNENYFIQKFFLKEMDELLPPSQYSVVTCEVQEINSHSQEWHSYGNSLFKNCGFPQCIFPWDSHPSLPWNTSKTAIILNSWDLFHWHGGTKDYQIEEELNN